jgi:uncharacterized protein (TIRG00374 family)
MIPDPKRKNIAALLKLAVGSSLILILLSRVELEELWNTLRAVNLYYLALMFVLPHVTIGINSVKWQIFLRLLGLDPGFLRSYGLYLISSFFSNFLPTTVGGDAVRAYLLGSNSDKLPAVTAATIMERYVGLAAMVSLVPLVLLMPAATNNLPILWVLAPASLIGFVVVTAGLLSPRLRKSMTRFFRFGRMERVVTFLRSTQSALAHTANSAGALLSTYFLSLIFYVGAALTVWAAVMSVNASVGVGYLIATVPVILLVGMLPISINGLGITEAGFAMFLQFVGVPPAESVAVGLLIRARILVTALIGGVLFLRFRRPEDSTTIRSDD